MNAINTLAGLRKERHISQEELAFKLGISRQALSAWENGKRTVQLRIAMKAAEMFGVTLDEIAGIQRD